MGVGRHPLHVVLRSPTGARRGLSLVSILGLFGLSLLLTSCFVVPPRCHGGRVYRGGMCVCPSPYAWSGVQRRCVRPRVITAPPARSRVITCGGGQVYVGGRCVCRSPYVWSTMSRRCVVSGVIHRPSPHVHRPAPRVRRPVPRVRRPAPRVRARRVACRGRMVFRGGRCVCPSPWVYSAAARKCVRVLRPGYKRVRVRRR